MNGGRNYCVKVFVPNRGEKLESLNEKISNVGIVKLCSSEVYTFSKFFHFLITLYSGFKFKMVLIHISGWKMQRLKIWGRDYYVFHSALRALAFS